MSATSGARSASAGAGPAGRQFHDVCPLCGSAAFKAYVERPQARWVKCDCGLIFKQWSAEPCGESVPFDPAATAYSKRWRRRVGKSRYQIRDVLNHIAPGPLLDIGCSLGYTLRAAQDLGLPAKGLEYDPGVAAFCRGKGYEVAIGTMTAMPFATGEFQIVVMKHVLEHTHDPRAALREVRRVLKPNGGVFIAVPHGGYNKVVRDPAHSRFFDYMHPETGHCIYYTPATLTRLMQEEGFTVAHVHPQLVHRSAPASLQALQRALAPAQWLIERLRDLARIRKEFWLVALKRDGL